jgi:hypothetical protein
MIVFVILITLTVIVLVTLVFTNEKWTNYSQVSKNINNKFEKNKTYNNYINGNSYNNTNTYIRKEYRLPYRYPVGFLYENPESHISTIHAYDINS